MTEKSDQPGNRENPGRSSCGRYVHGRRNGSRSRIGVLLGLEKAELRSKLVAPDMLALADRWHWSGWKSSHDRRCSSRDILVLCYIHIKTAANELIRWLDYSSSQTNFVDKGL
jgi:hypothetical protein